MRDGVSLTEQHHVRYLATPTDLMRLDNLEAFIKFPRNLDISKLKFKIYDCPEIGSPLLSNNANLDTADQEVTNKPLKQLDLNLEEKIC